METRYILRETKRIQVNGEGEDIWKVDFDVDGEDELDFEEDGGDF